MALRAGKYAAINPTSARNSAAATNVNGSVVDNPNNWLFKYRVNSKETGIATTMPVPATMLTSASTSRKMVASVAPTANRIPISRVLLATMKASTP